MKKKYFWLVIAVCWCLAIFMATASPASTGNHTQQLIMKYTGITYEQAATVNLLFRKFVHLSSFGLLAIFFYKSFEKNAFLNAWLLATLYAASDEIHQAFVPNRTASILDVGIDSIGAILALLLLTFLSKKHLSRKK